MTSPGSRKGRRHTGGEDQGARPALARRLGRLDTTMLVAGGIMGSGIFLVPGLVAGEVGTPGLTLLVWLACGLLALCGALCYAELSAAIPEAGGTYPFLERAYRLPALPFLYAWSMLFVVYTGAIAAVATAFALHAGILLDGWLPFGPWSQRFLAVGCIVFLGGLNVLGVQVGGRVQTAVTLAKLAALGVIVVVGFAFGSGGADPFTLVPDPEDGTLRVGTAAAFGTAMIAALFAYNGWWLSSFVAEEVKEPERTVPLSIFFGVAIVICTYLLVNLAYLNALPFERLEGSPTAAVDAMIYAIGPAGGSLVAVAVMIATFGTLNAQLLGYPRISFVLGREVPSLGRLGRTHPRFRTPAVAIGVHVIWASVLAVTGTFAQLITFIAFPNFLFLTLAVAGLIILRRREPALPRPYRVWGYPFTPLLFVGVFAWYLGNSIVHRFDETMIGILITLSGLPVYLWLAKGRERGPDGAAPGTGDRRRSRRGGPKGR